MLSDNDLLVTDRDWARIQLSSRNVGRMDTAPPERSEGTGEYSSSDIVE